MKYFIMGDAGFTGGPLILYLIRTGHEVTALARTVSRVKYLPPQAAPLVGDPLKPGKWQNIAGQADVIINLAGRPIMTRWTKTTRKKIVESRILPLASQLRRFLPAGLSK